MQTPRSQRWRERRQHFVPNATAIDPSAYSVDRIDSAKMAKPFVEQHHYSGSYPASRADFGLWRNGKGGTSTLVGVCTFSVPVNNASIPLRSGVDAANGADLGRFVLLDDVAGNGESYFLARALRQLRQAKPDIISVVAYSDPVRRIDEHGRIVMPGHIGSIYQVCAARHVGRSAPRTDFIFPDGTLLSPRAIAKIRAQHTGAAYAERQILRYCAEPRAFAEDPGVWLARLARDGVFQRRRHPGNHVYVFPLTQAARIAIRAKPDVPYPVIDRSIVAGDVTALPLLCQTTPAGGPT